MHLNHLERRSPSYHCVVTNTSGARKPQIRATRSGRPRVNRTVRQSIELAPDLELHISKVAVPGQEALELRNFTPSDKTYGRGVVVPLDVARSLKRALDQFIRIEEGRDG